MKQLLIAISIFIGGGYILAQNHNGSTNQETYVPYIPIEKNLDKNWVQSLYEKGEQKIYKGNELKYISMPCGGIGAGQLEITAYGKLGSWYIFNEAPATNRGRGFTTGAGYMKPLPIEDPVENGFAIKIRQKNKEAIVLPLNGDAFDKMEFIGEYPIAELKFAGTKQKLPVNIYSKVFSPFVPLDVRSSANPVTTLSYTVTNNSTETLEIDLAGWLQNVVKSKEESQRINTSFKGKNLTGVQLSLNTTHTYPPQKREEKVLFDDFESNNFSNNWLVEGNAFSQAPLKIFNAKFPDPISQYKGVGIASSRHYKWDSQRSTGKLISKPFTIDHQAIRFLIAGGSFENETCFNLMVDGEIVKSSCGNHSFNFEEITWDVSNYKGKTAHFEIIDSKEDGKKHDFIMVDDIYFVNKGVRSPAIPKGNGEAGYGDLSISVIDAKAQSSAVWKNETEFLQAFKNTEQAAIKKRVFKPTENGIGTVTSSFKLKPNQSKTVTFLISWYFPNLYNNEAGGCVGHIYNNWYNNSVDVAQWVSHNFDDLSSKTELFRSTYHNTSLPYWLTNRISMPVSTLACQNVLIHENGRMYAFEGVNFCSGTCGHVYNFVSAIANLFPELERSVRTMQDFNENFGFDILTGRINFRGSNGNDAQAYNNYASDAQSGYVLKAYREHLHSTDNRFLERVWPQVKMAMHYQIFRDGAERSLAPNGVLEDKQTFWDPMWWGPNPYNNTLYLAALRAAEEMAKLMGENELASRYNTIFKSGTDWMQRHMWNGAYYVSLYPEGTWSSSWNGVVTLHEEQNNAASYVRQFGTRKQHYYMATACDAQQLFGQNWANQLALGYILPPEHCRSAAKSIFKYNWTHDISNVYNVYPPHNRTLAATGEAAMVNGAWPKVARQDFENTHDKDDVWTGLEYEAACDMINEGLTNEALIIIRSIHDRYNGEKRNPWNEVEGADHYSRAMQAWNVLLSLGGFSYNGPKAEMAFNPKITPSQFKSFFSAAEGWGNIEQQRDGNSQQNVISLAHGSLSLNKLSVNLAENIKCNKLLVKVNGRTVSATPEQIDNKLIIQLDANVEIQSNQKLILTIN